MKYRVITLPAAEAYIRMAAAWMDEHLPGGAAKWVQSIRLAIRSLSDMPGRCPIASEYRAPREGCGNSSTVDADIATAFCLRLARTP